MDIHQFFLGNAFDAHTYFGAHFTEDGVVFRTLAPNAKAVDLIWEGGDWKPIPMKRIHDGGIYEALVPDAIPGQMYKYRITPQNPDGESIDHCDPYGFGMELRPNNASIIRDLTTFTFHDKKWMQRRGSHHQKPVNIYEVHLGSWHTNPDDPNGWYTYAEIAPKLVDYVKKTGYNYIEFMPLSEHPADCSWGYQNTGFFSPTSRYGTADDLKEMIDILHQHNIGTILDFVPVHFALDGYGLARYDGTALYEYPSNDVGYSEWGSMNFIHSKGEVRSFLQSAANYWLSEYHFDGLRMDAISRIIYWMGDESRGVNDRAVDFIRNMNQGLKDRHPSIILCAEDSTDFKGTTKETKYGGLGFDYKWDMGWMNDTLNFFRTLPFVRGEHYHDLTFSMMYNYNERYLLPLSHDEVVHGKATIIQKMAGMYEEKFPQAKALYAYMYAHPGKKLNFMGNEIGQFREWDEKREQDWDLLKYPNHDSFHQYMKEPALSAWDDDPNGFAWILCGKENDVVYIFQREVNEDKVIVVLNLSGLVYKNYHFNYGNGDTMKVLINSDWNKFGGSTKDTEKTIKGVNGDFGFDLPAFSGIYLKPVD